MSFLQKNNYCISNSQLLTIIRNLKFSSFTAFIHFVFY